MTRDAYGRDAVLLMRQNAVAGTPQTLSDGPFIRLPFISASLGVTQGLEREAELPSSRLPTRAVNGLGDAAGSLTVLADVEALGWHLFGMFGAPSTTGAGPDYVHEWALGLSGGPEHTLHIEHSGLDVPDYVRHLNYVYNSMQFNVAKSGQAQRFTFGLLGSDEEVAGASVAAGSVERAENDLFRSWQGSVSVPGAPASVVSLDFTVSNGFESDQGLLNQRATPEGFLLGDVTGGGNITVRHRGDFYRNLARTSGRFDATLRWEQTPARYLEMVLHNLVIPRQPQNVEGSGPIETAYPCELDQPNTGTAPVTVRLGNGRADYAMPAA